MSDLEEPKIPMKMKLYYLLRNIITPNLSIIYILFESVFISFISIIILIYLQLPNYVILTSLFSPIIVIILYISQKKKFKSNIVEIFKSVNYKFIIITFFIYFIFLLSFFNHIR